MTVSTGLKFFVSSFLYIGIFSLPVDAQTIKNSPPSEANYKDQLQKAVAGAKPVKVQENDVSMPAGALSSPMSVKAPDKEIIQTKPIDESEIQDAEPLPPAVQDSEEITPLHVGLDKPEIVHLDRDAVNVIVGSNENLRVVPDTNKTLVLIAKKPGSTYFRALDADGKVIMQRHVIVGSPTKNYIRIRRACANGTSGCKQYSVYYCPDMCHEINVVQDAAGPSTAIPQETPAGTQNGTDKGAAGNQEPLTTPATSEPPPGE